ncbi:MAG: CHAT domain-containing protein [Actinobacteria bacterium]|nr:CHAT domain-containing protein [Actinomycetota bacterium]
MAAEVVLCARAWHDDELLAEALRAVAWTHRAHWGDREARRLLDGALRAARRAGARGVEATVLASRASVLLELGRPAAARRDLAAASAAMAADPFVAPDERERFEVRTLLARAVLEQNSGRPVQAASLYRELLGRRGLDAQGAVIVANNLALTLAEQGDYEGALVSATDAVVRAGPLGPSMLAPTTGSRAWIATRAGHLGAALRDFEEAERLYRAADLPLGEHYGELADVMADLRLLPEAVHAAGRAEAEFDGAGAHLMRLEARLRRARYLLLEGDLVGAQDVATATAEEARAQRRPGWRDRALLIAVQARVGLDEVAPSDLVAARRLAGRLDAAGDLHAAVDAHLVAGKVGVRLGQGLAAARAFDRAAGLARSGPALVRTRGHVAGARAALLRGDDERALAECSAGLREVARLRDDRPTIELRALASGHGAELGELGLGVLVGTGRPVQVLRWMERTRAAALIGSVGEPFLPPAERLASPGVEPGDRAGATLRTVLQAEAEPVRRVAADAWRPRGTARRVGGAPPGVARLRAALDGRVLVELGQHGGRLVAVVLDGRGARLVELAGLQAVTDQLHGLLFALRRLADPSSPASAQAARVNADARLVRLRTLLVEPLGVAPDAELVVVPVGLLHSVPWSALHEAPVALAPSAAAWLRTAGGPAPSGRTVLVAGPDLDGAREEVEALRAVHPGAQVLGPQDGTAHAVLAALAGADLAHLACHGVLRADSPMFSSVMLADGPVTVQELHGAGAAPRRLVLASCHSGADVAYAGDEVLGFVSATLSRGTTAVVASLAAVPDVEAVGLMVALHRELAAGATMARALHAARAQLDRAAPGGFVSWCSFAAHGAG